MKTKTLRKVLSSALSKEQREGAGKKCKVQK